MMLFVRASGFVAAALTFLFHNLAFAQTSTKCNPLHQSCPPDPALGKTADIDFSSGSSNQFTPSGNGISYDSQGLHLTVAKSGDSPTLTSNFYLMFGKVDIELKAAAGTGIVSSAVLQSDDLDEIDWEFLGGDPDRVQTNYFGKGQTGSYDRGAFSADSGSQNSLHTYTIDWTTNQVTWQIDGQTVRALQPANANGQYPQSPMQIKLGSWAGGDSSNAAGVIAWAGGPTDYTKGPFTMYVKSVKAQDYSTGSQYVYSDSTGTWQSIHAVGGSVNSGGSGTVDTSSPMVTSTSSGQPMPFDGTHAQPSSSYSMPNVYPWVPGGTSLTTTAASAATSIPGLPVGWSVSSSGKAVPPSSAPSTPPVASSTSSSQSWPQAAPSPVGSSDGKQGTPLYTITSSPTVTPSPPAAASSPKYSPYYVSAASSSWSHKRNATAVGTSSAKPVYTGAAAASGGTAVANLAAAAGAFGCLALIL